MVILDCRNDVEIFYVGLFIWHYNTQSFYVINFSML